MKIVYFDAPDRVSEGSLWFHFSTGIFTTKYRGQHCSHKIQPPGKDAAGRRKRPRFCTNKAMYAKFLGNGEWAEPLCTAHYRKRDGE